MWAYRTVTNKDSISVSM
uniref:Uncharacterized protein n=1 Tax=Arundo donax TaxID=35708 RepID=A0A0A9B528_ARUDO